MANVSSKVSRMFSWLLIFLAASKAFAFMPPSILVINTLGRRRHHPVPCKAFALREVDFSDPPCLGETWNPPLPPGGGGGGGGGGGAAPLPDEEGLTFIITRRMVQACGIFNDVGQLVLQKMPGGTVKPPPHVFVGEYFLPTRASTRLMARTNTSGGAPEGGFDDCRPAAAARYNYNLSRMNKALVSVFSSGGVTPKAFNQTNTFKTLFAEAAIKLNAPLEQLLQLNYITETEHKQLKQYRVNTLADLFKPSAESISNINLNDIRRRIVIKGR